MLPVVHRVGRACALVVAVAALSGAGATGAWDEGFGAFASGAALEAYPSVREATRRALAGEDEYGLVREAIEMIRASLRRVFPHPEDHPGGDPVCGFLAGTGGGTVRVDGGGGGTPRVDGGGLTVLARLDDDPLQPLGTAFAALPRRTIEAGPRPGASRLVIVDRFELEAMAQAIEAAASSSDAGAAGAAVFVAGETWDTYAQAISLAAGVEVRDDDIVVPHGHLEGGASHAVVVALHERVERERHRRTRPSGQQREHVVEHEVAVRNHDVGVAHLDARGEADGLGVRVPRVASDHGGSAYGAFAVRRSGSHARQRHRLELEAVDDDEAAGARPHALVDRPTWDVSELVSQRLQRIVAHPRQDGEAATVDARGAAATAIHPGGAAARASEEAAHGIAARVALRMRERLPEHAPKHLDGLTHLLILGLVGEGAVDGIANRRVHLQRRAGCERLEALVPGARRAGARQDGDGDGERARSTDSVHDLQHGPLPSRQRH